MNSTIGKVLQSRGSHVLILAVTSLGVIAAATAISVSRHIALGLIAVFVTGGILVVAARRFELFTLIMIAARTAVDLTHTVNDTRLLRLSVLITGAYTIVAGIWLIVRRSRDGLRVSTVTAWVALFTTASLTSAVFSVDPGQAAIGASRWVFLTVFVLTLENLVFDERAAKRVTLAVAISAVVPLIMGVLQFQTSDLVSSDGIPRIQGSFSHPNTYAFYLVVVGLILISILRHLTPRLRNVAAGLLGAVLLSLLATYSRTSYVAFLVGLVVVIILGRRRGLMIVAGLAVAAALLFPGVADRLNEVGQATTVRGTAGDSLAWRFDYWQDIIGVGEGHRITGLGLGVASDLTEQGREPHNDFVRAFVEVGWIGLIAFAGLMLALGKRVMRALAVTSPRGGATGFSRGLAEGFAAVFAAYLVASVTGNLMTQLILLWYVLAIGVAATIPHEKGRRIAARPTVDVANA